MDFLNACEAFAERARLTEDAIFHGVVGEVATSIIEGSPITGAPGQPVRENILKPSWGTHYLSPTEALVGSGGVAAGYNRAIEDGQGRFGPFNPARGTYPEPRTSRSRVGGYHSVALTRAAFAKIVYAVAAQREARA